MLNWSALKPAVKLLRSQKVGILPTDTIYGLVASALDFDSVERLYEIRYRDKNKPVIVLIGRISDLKLFGIKLSSKLKKSLKRYWPGPISIIFPVSSPRFSHIHRGGGSIAFRLPQNRPLRRLLKKTGPICAPSANPQGEAPAQDIETAKKYFANQVDFYIDCGEIKNPPSTVLKIEGNTFIVVRKGAA
ncbi:MAG: threonylcarbamoyl-AMP synthase [Candidatus Harrisonbacteria bacterium CG10_big_fil_rev_8_21_14_0_10_44_23]|uniref:L-threonylcarbamoyladenylate synthase n=1 Tax=Candidatus Harrisonbacteria bacterium CG10_big_fil_rev_8_21_14_0_10_44_23 TaxID=1974585 RepID=A0A2H0US50_9BACT|nr:MAG: threonylcarbamoyl-AMP synthase [Candidatus Harrisonbacteria bacterium CG10_big_fil_rev_8_21_14_0_10_44_23]